MAKQTRRQPPPDTAAAVPIALPEFAAARGISLEIWSALTTSLYPGARPESVCALWDYCKARRLDPLKRPCHIVPMDVTDAATGRKGKRDVIMPGIYELRTTAMRTGMYAGMDDPQYGPTERLLGIEAPAWCTITVWRFVEIGDRIERIAFPHTERFVEACATRWGDKPGDRVANSMWTRRPFGQLAKCTEAGALRKAFPDEFGGVMTADEIHVEPPGAYLDAPAPSSDSAPDREPEPRSGSKSDELADRLGSRAPSEETSRAEPGDPDGPLADVLAQIERLTARDSGAVDQIVAAVNALENNADKPKAMAAMRERLEILDALEAVAPEDETAPTLSELSARVARATTQSQIDEAVDLARSALLDDERAIIVREAAERIQSGEIRAD